MGPFGREKRLNAPRNSFIKYSSACTQVSGAPISPASASGINYTPKTWSLFHAQLPCGGGGEILNAPDLSGT
jgi:hypothetical protein